MYMGKFSYAQGQILKWAVWSAKFKLSQDFIPVLVTGKFKEDLL